MKDLSPPYKKLVSGVGSAFALFFLYTTVFGPFSAHYQRGMYFLFTAVLIFLTFPASKKSSLNTIGLLDSILIIMTVISVGYWMASYYLRATERLGEFNKPEIFFSLIILILAFEVSRRVLGKTLTILAACLVVYCFIGPYIPGVYGHKGFKVKRVIEFMGGMEGIFGVAISCYASFVFLFIIFAAFLENTGIGEYIINLANSVAGRFRGGPAKVSVIASALVGSIMGSGVSNVVTTGSFTIPMMKRIGFKPHIAAAVEAAASTGGQFMPPVMGAGAFLIAAFTETSYFEICKMAAIPAILYFISVLAMVHFEAVKTGVKALPNSEIPPIGETLKKIGNLVIPVGAIIYILLIGHSPNRAALAGILCVIVLSFFSKGNRLNLNKFFKTLADGSLNSLTVGATGGVVGVIIGATTISGLGIKISDSIVTLASGNLILTLFFVMIASYILGMSMTVVADYIIVSAVAVPALVTLGVPLISAHLLIFWLVNSSGVTPPVAISAFAAASIAKADPNKVGYAALKMSMALFITPLIFIYLPDILYGPIAIRIMYGVSCTFAFIAVAAAIQGYFLKKTTLFERMVLILTAFCLFHPLFWTDLIGYGLFLLLFIKQFYFNNTKKYNV